MIPGKLGYALRETLANLRRNMLLTTASILTVAVSLALVGAALLLRHGVDNTAQRWEGGIQIEVFLLPEATPNQTSLVGSKLLASADVERATYVTQEENFELFRQMFQDRPEFRDVTKDVMPPSYRVEPAVADPDVIEALGDRIANEPGVKDVVYARETVRQLLRVSNVMQVVIFSIAAVLLFSASLLIFNTIRMAIFARRREIEVMKLVGATNWFIRVPFMIEGLVQGVLGSALAFLVVYIGRNAAEEAIRSVALFNSFVLQGSQVASTGVLVIVLGAVIGTVGAGVAVTKFLDV